jgi:hypothetical protein
MPSKSPAQARLMAAAAHTPGGYGGVPQSVGKEFNKADAGTGILSKGRKHMAKGGKAGFGPHHQAVASDNDADDFPSHDQVVAKAHGGAVKPHHEHVAHLASGGNASARADGVASKGKTKGEFV